MRVALLWSTRLKWLPQDAAGEIGERRIDGHFHRRVAVRAADFERAARRCLVGEVGRGAVGEPFHRHCLRKILAQLSRQARDGRR